MTHHACYQHERVLAFCDTETVDSHAGSAMHTLELL